MQLSKGKQKHAYSLKATGCIHVQFISKCNLLVMQHFNKSGWSRTLIWSNQMVISQKIIYIRCCGCKICCRANSVCEKWTHIYFPCENKHPFFSLHSICCLSSLLSRFFPPTAMRGDPEPDIDAACVSESKGDVKQTGVLVSFLHAGMTCPTSGPTDPTKITNKRRLFRKPVSKKQLLWIIGPAFCKAPPWITIN